MTRPLQSVDRRVERLAHQLELLHDRLLAGDSTASDAIFKLALPGLKRWARRSVTDADESIAEDGALEALRKYFDRPSLYDRGRGRLLDWLRTCAVNATRNLTKPLRRAREHEVGGLDLEVIAPAVALTGQAEANEAHRLERRRQVRHVLADPVERAFADAHLDGQPVRAQAEIIGAAGLSEAEQRKLISVWWHRVRAKITWWIGRSSEPE